MIYLNYSLLDSNLHSVITKYEITYDQTVKNNNTQTHICIHLLTVLLLVFYSNKQTKSCL